MYVSGLDGTFGSFYMLDLAFGQIKKHVIKYWTTVYERSGRKLLWSIKMQVKFIIH